MYKIYVYVYGSDPVNPMIAKGSVLRNAMQGVYLTLMVFCLFILVSIRLM